MAEDICVKITSHLRKSLPSTQLNQLVLDFFEWKRLGPGGEYLSYTFGKDGFYIPPACPANTMMHVHMMPPSASPLRPQWDVDYTRTKRDGTPFPSRKVSNKALIYAAHINSFSKKKTFLLIAILDDPNSHEIIKRLTPEHDALMKHFTSIAESFIMDMKQPKEFIDQSVTISSHADFPI